MTICRSGVDGICICTRISQFNILTDSNWHPNLDQRNILLTITTRNLSISINDVNNEMPELN